MNSELVNLWDIPCKATSFLQIVCPSSTSGTLEGSKVTQNLLQVENKIKTKREQG